MKLFENNFFEKSIVQKLVTQIFNEGKLVSISRCVRITCSELVNKMLQACNRSATRLLQHSRGYQVRFFLLVNNLSSNQQAVNNFERYLGSKVINNNK